jgi:hypothetical protein
LEERPVIFQNFLHQKFLSKELTLNYVTRHNLNLNPKQKCWHAVNKKITHEIYLKNMAKSNNPGMFHDSGNENIMRFTYNYLYGKNQLIPELCAKCYADVSVINTGDTADTRSKNFIWLNSVE